MKDHKTRSILLAYLQERLWLVLGWLLALFIYVLILTLYGLPAEAVAYATFLLCCFTLWQAPGAIPVTGKNT